MGTQRRTERIRPGAGAPERSVVAGEGVSGEGSAISGAGAFAVAGSDGGLAGSGGTSVTGAAAASAGDGGVELSDSVGVAEALEVCGDRFLG
jgi:hypothetical protein